MIVGGWEDNGDFNPKHAYNVVDKTKTPEKYQQTLVIFMNTQQARIIRDELDRLIKNEPRENFAAHLKIHTGLN